MSLKKRSLKIQGFNSYGFNMNKVTEELTELLLVLIHKKTKVGTSTEVTNDEIIDEIGDAKRMLWYLESQYDEKAIKNRIKSKVLKLEKKYKIC